MFKVSHFKWLIVIGVKIHGFCKNKLFFPLNKGHESWIILLRCKKKFYLRIQAFYSICFLSKLSLFVIYWECHRKVLSHSTGNAANDFLSTSTQKLWEMIWNWRISSAYMCRCILESEQTENRQNVKTNGNFIWRMSSQLEKCPSIVFVWSTQKLYFVTHTRVKMKMNLYRCASRIKIYFCGTVW